MRKGKENRRKGRMHINVRLNLHLYMYYLVCPLMQKFHTQHSILTSSIKLRASELFKEAFI